MEIWLALAIALTGGTYVSYKTDQYLEARYRTKEHERLKAEQETHELEFAYTTYRESCRDPHLSDGGELRECRRPHGHKTMPHASGYGSAYYTWEN